MLQTLVNKAENLIPPLEGKIDPNLEGAANLFRVESHGFIPRLTIFTSAIWLQITPAHAEGLGLKSPTEIHKQHTAEMRSRFLFSTNKRFCSQTPKT